MAAYVVIAFACLWIAGWLSTFFETDHRGPAWLRWWWLQEAYCLVATFFIWPYITWAMARARH